MKLSDLKNREVALLNSHNSQYVEYGKALMEIVSMCGKSIEERLSDDMFISNVAQKYVEKEQRKYKLSKNKKHLLHVKAAYEYIKKDAVPFNRIYDDLVKYKRELTFEDAKELLWTRPWYNKVNVVTLKAVLEKINEMYKNNSQ